jgi:hypothetical protein
MPCININSCEQWSLTFYISLSSYMLQLSNVFERMEWYNTIVMICGCHHHSWVFLMLDVVKRGVFDQVVNTSVFIGISKVRAPEVTNCESMETKHIGHWNLTDHGSV